MTNNSNGNNGGGDFIARALGPGVRETVKTTAESAWSFLTHGLGAVGILVVALLAGIFALGFSMIQVGALALLGWFAIKAIAAASDEAQQFKDEGDPVKARQHFWRCVGFAVSAVICGSVIVTLVVQRDVIRQYWPVPAVEVHEYPAAPVPTPPVFDARAVFIPLVGTTGTGEMLPDPIAPGPSSVLLVDGKPLAELSEDHHAQMKHLQGALVIVRGVLLVGVVMVAALALTLAIANGRDIWNPNTNATLQQAPHFWPGAWGLLTVFDPQARRLQRAAIAQALGVPLEQPQEVEKVHEVITITQNPNGTHGTQYKGDFTWVSLAQWEALTPIVLADNAVLSLSLRPRNAGRPFTRKQADEFVAACLHQQFVKDIGSNQNQLTDAGREFFGDEKWRQWFLTPTTTS